MNTRREKSKNSESEPCISLLLPFSVLLLSFGLNLSSWLKDRGCNLHIRVISIKVLPSSPLLSSSAGVFGVHLKRQLSGSALAAAATERARAALAAGSDGGRARETASCARVEGGRGTQPSCQPGTAPCFRHRFAHRQARHWTSCLHR